MLICFFREARYFRESDELPPAAPKAKTKRPATTTTPSKKSGAGSSNTKQLVWTMSRKPKAYSFMLIFKKSLMQGLITTESENYKPADYKRHFVSKLAARIPKDTRPT